MENQKEDARCEICDRNAYHKNDWHCSQGKEKTDCNYCKAPYDSGECDCVYCCVCGEVNMTELTDNMEDTCVECKEEYCVNAEGERKHYPEPMLGNSWWKNCGVGQSSGYNTACKCAYTDGAKNHKWSLSDMEDYKYDEDFGYCEGGCGQRERWVNSDRYWCKSCEMVDIQKRGIWNSVSVWGWNEA